MLKTATFTVTDRQTGEYSTYQSPINQRDPVIALLFRGGIHVECPPFKHHSAPISNTRKSIITKTFSDEEQILKSVGRCNN